MSTNPSYHYLALQPITQSDVLQLFVQVFPIVIFVPARRELCFVLAFIETARLLQIARSKNYWNEESLHLELILPVLYSI